MCEEIVSVLQDFHDFTLLIHDNEFSITLVKPCYVSCLRNLVKLPQLRFCERLKQKLIQSLKTRFDYLQTETFYSIAAMLNPQFGTKWFEKGEVDYLKNSLKDKLTEFQQKFGLESEIESFCRTENTEKEPPKREFDCFLMPKIISLQMYTE